MIANNYEHVIATNLAQIRERIAVACEKCGRSISEVQILAVSKGQPVEAIRTAYALGLRDFGENYVQEWSTKQQALADLADLRWHFIGHLQSNKARYLFNSVNFIHSVDREGIAEVLERRRLQLGHKSHSLGLFLQLEIDASDQNKHATKEQEVEQLCRFLRHLESVAWLGFMGMGPVDKSPAELREMYQNFAQKASNLWTHWAPPNSPAKPQLSLGMTDDLEIAIESGSTIVRIGTGIFGARPDKDAIQPA